MKCALSCGTSAAALLPAATSMKLLLVLMSSLAVVDAPESVSVKAEVGDDVILPCHLETTFDMVTWELNKKTVHSYRSMADNPMDQHEQFKGRTSLFHKEMSGGNCSLKLTNVTEEDAGTYDVRLNRELNTGAVILTVEPKNSNNNQPDKSDTVTDTVTDKKRPGGDTGIIVGIVSAYVLIAITIILLAKFWKNPTKTRKTNEQPKCEREQIALMATSEAGTSVVFKS